MKSSKLKIVSSKKIEELLKTHRKNNKKIVTINGSFDLLHSGHVYSLETAKKQGDILIVGLNSDKSYKFYKDKRGPIIDEENRAIMLASLECVDYVVIFNEADPIKLLSIIKPDIHCNGAEYGKNCIEANTVYKNSGRLFLIKERKDKKNRKISSSKIIKKIFERFSK